MDTEEEQIVKVSIFTPLIYVAVLMAAFVTFLVVYRRKRLQKLTAVEPIFPANYPQWLYQFLKAQLENQEIPKEARPHERVLKAALLRRGVEAIRRLLKLKEIEPAFTKLYQEGLVGEEVFKNFEIQARFQEIELKEIVQEVESYKKGWAQTFFPVAQEICFNEALRRRLNAEKAREVDLAELWDYYVDKSEKVKVEGKSEKLNIEGKSEKPTEKVEKLVKKGEKEQKLEKVEIK